jgi:hypothetical protein
LSTNHRKPKTLLFSNGDYQKQRPLKFSDCLGMTISELTDLFFSVNPYNRRNLGTYLMTDTLVKNIDAKWIRRNHDFSQDKDVDSVVTNHLHCISSHFEVDLPYWENILKYPIKVIPLSAGFLYNGENGGHPPPLSNDIVYLFSAIAERNEIGVRGEYDADILERHGIKNVRVIGCPSLFYHMNRNFQVRCMDKMNNLNFTFSTDFANLNISQKVFLHTHMKPFWYVMNIYREGRIGVDFTMQKAPTWEISDLSRIINYDEARDFFAGSGRFFFSVADWIAALRKNDFCLGTRFHGNIAGILASVPTLMLNIDGRMRGLNRYHKIPSIDIEEFDPGRPVEYYRELCDYSEFNKNYSTSYDNFIDYCRKNDVALKSECEEV